MLAEEARKFGMAIPDTDHHYYPVIYENRVDERRLKETLVCISLSLFPLVPPGGVYFVLLVELFQIRSPENGCSV